jgi:hypothetical protein
MFPRWVLASTGRAHLDLGERSSQSLRVRADHIIVTACRAHIDANATVVPDRYSPRCSNCLSIMMRTVGMLSSIRPAVNEDEPRDGTGAR